jgi:hypothetical protein
MVIEGILRGQLDMGGVLGGWPGIMLSGQLGMEGSMGGWPGIGDGIGKQLLCVYVPAERDCGFGVSGDSLQFVVGF